MEYPEKGIWDGPTDDWLWKAYHGDRFNFWAYIDNRDAAQAAEKAVIADFEGSHPLFVVNDQNWSGYNSQKLIDLFFPNVKTMKREIQGAATMVSIEKARSLIGFKPEYYIPE
jgi:UDP-glucose 4-epimerase